MLRAPVEAEKNINVAILEDNWIEIGQGSKIDFNLHFFKTYF